ncbi:DUF5000 domain-containing lipoprotein [Dawidia soli]|uniref:DUF4959 domain-containing protein n=1 Tax=Dawidia soli TaxID=2782352 RepID=A0AAP2DEJ3_9BACT|nr:DUF5000 domain-containing lipoprotein [Dawidia soli]MBT1689275.1 DUF4959 domain-containing protein [Dawidia soli]
MKRNTIAIFYRAALFVLALTACEEGGRYVDPVSEDTSKPLPVSNIEVHNFNGGAHITYTLPNSENLLYVQAEYAINDVKTRQTKSSYYSDTITVRGFAKSQDYDVTLYAVTRANVKSDPVVVKVHPDTPPYLMVRPTLDVTPDFGGLSIRALNPLEETVGVVVVTYDSVTRQQEIVDQHYTDDDTIRHAVRGYRDIPRSFGIYVTDEFGNISDTLRQDLTPLFEQVLNKQNFFVYQLPSDGEIAYGWELRYLWDNKVDAYSQGWHTAPGGPLPIICTFGLGGTFQLSRFVLYERTAEFTYSHGNPRRFSIWGSSVDSPQDAELPRYSPAGTVVGDWVNLGSYRFPDPPSGLPPGATNVQDAAFVLAGINFDVPINSPAVKFIRFSVSDTWSNGDFAHAMELTFYGKPE